MKTQKTNNQYVLKSIQIAQEVLAQIAQTLLKDGTVKVYRLGTFTLTRFKSSTSPLMKGKTINKLRVSFRSSAVFKAKLKRSRKK